MLSLKETENVYFINLFTYWKLNIAQSEIRSRHARWYINVTECFTALFKIHKYFLCFFGYSWAYLVLTTLFIHSLILNMYMYNLFAGEYENCNTS